jgi:predicted RNA-binding protein (virulence factor B family)
VIQNGRWHTLQFNRQSPHGWYLIDRDDEEVLLPNKYLPEKIIVGQETNVFVYRDSEERLVATYIKPLIELNTYAILDIVAVSEYGAFANWGMEKHLFIPFREQHQKLKEGDYSIVYMYLDEVTDRLVGSARVNRWLRSDTPEYKKGQKVSALVYYQNEVGYQVIIEQAYRGIIYTNEVFEPLKIGDRIQGYVRQIREGGLVDLSYTPLGRSKISSYQERILREINSNGGFLALNDKAEPEEIQQILQMSKKSFKEAIGGLYRERMIDFYRNGIRLIGEE